MMNHYTSEAATKPVPVCPVCGKRARESQTRYGLRNTCCGLWSWDRHPMVSAETHAARTAAHLAFDQLWKGGTMARHEAYSKLREVMGLTKDQCHMKLMDFETAKRVPEAVLEIINVEKTE